MLCTTKVSSLNPDLMVFGNYVVVIIVLMCIYVYMYVSMYVVSDKFVMDHGCLMLMFICIFLCMYVVV